MNKLRNFYSYLLFIFLCLTASSVFAQLTIHDIQYTDDPYGDSPYVGQTKTVMGIVTSSAQIYDLGYIYIQDEGGGPWSGIPLYGSGLANLYRGEEVTVTGIVKENFGRTYLDVIEIELTGQLKDLSISEIDPSDSSAYINNGWEKWESVLVEYKDPDGSLLYISHPVIVAGGNYGDYAVSSLSKKAAKKLGLILAGRQTSNYESSLYVQIVNDSIWADNSGTMQVPVIETSTSMQMEGVVGLLFYIYGDYHLLPRNNDDFVGINVELDSTQLPLSPLGIPESKKSIFEVSPNPASDFVNVFTDIYDETEISIYNLTGKLVANQPLNESPQRIAVTDLKNGIYIMRLTANGKKIQSTQIIVQR